MDWLQAGSGYVLLGSAGDYCTTVYGVESGGMGEANPVAVAFMETFGTAPGFLLLSLVGIVAIGAIAWSAEKQPFVASSIPSVVPLAVFGSIKLFATVWNANLLFF